MEKYYEAVENVLKKYPESWQRNYYQNKSGLIIKEEESDFIFTAADYSHEDNIITIYNGKNSSLPHELFHMSFRDKEKVNKEICNDFLYSNGISFKEKESEKNYLTATTEGFADYLTSFIKPDVGHPIEYFFISLLINIYGEEILEFSFLNDPLGFMKYHYFYHVENITQELEKYSCAIEELTYILYLKKSLDEIANRDKEALKEITNIMGNIIKQLETSIQELFDSIIVEFQECKNSKIAYDEFIARLSTFLTNPAYNFVFFSKNSEAQKIILQNKISNI